MDNYQDIGKNKPEFQNTYRLVLMNNETFEEINSYQLTLKNIYILISSIIVTIAVIVYLIIAFTPLKEYLPGYIGKKSELEVQKLAQQVFELEKQLISQRAYTENFGKILTGEVNILDSLVQSQNKKTIISTSTASPTEPTIEDLFFMSPLNGEISYTFLPDEKHYGVDVLAPSNTPIKAVLDGVVFFSDWTLETGNTIGIQHGNNIVSFYKHNSVLLKKSGNHVKAGEAIAIIGNTGKLSNGPHLHFELWFSGQPVDPNEYLSF
jgi:murein DD-endopeptidase MepM/ murein hydrolase activator NlpD